MSSLEEYKHKYVYELTLKIVGDCVVHVDDPPTREAGIKVEDVDGLIDKLRNEAGVL